MLLFSSFVWNYNSLNSYCLCSSQAKNVERDELYNMIKECMDDGPEIPEINEEVKAAN